MRALHKSADHKPGRNLTVNFVTKHGQTGIGSTHKSAHNNLLRKGQERIPVGSFNCDL